MVKAERLDDVEEESEGPKA